MKMEYWAKRLPWKRGEGYYGYGYGDCYGYGYGGGYDCGHGYGDCYDDDGHSNTGKFHPSWLITGDEFINILVQTHFKHGVSLCTQ